MVASVEDYVRAADRENTVRSYASAIKNFEEALKGLLPTTADTVARYLVEHATAYRLSTLRLHLAALARWHADNGFADPTRSPLVLKVLRGIRAKHATPQRRARPLQLEDGAALLDVRRHGAYRQADWAIAGARWYDPAQIEAWGVELPVSQPVVVYCVHGHEVSRTTTLRLRAAGRDARFLRGGIGAWTAAGRPLVDKPVD